MNENTPLLASVPAEHKLMQTRLPARIGVVDARKFVTAQLGAPDRADFEDAIRFALVPGKTALVDSSRLRLWVADRLALVDPQVMHFVRAQDTNLRSGSGDVADTDDGKAQARCFCC